MPNDNPGAIQQYSWDEIAFFSQQAAELPCRAMEWRRGSSAKVSHLCNGGVRVRHEVDCVRRSHGLLEGVRRLG